MTVKDAPGLKTDISIIPVWAYMLATAVFILTPVAFMMFSGLWRPDSDAPYLFRLLVSFLPGTILAFLALMVGYVNRDAGRRGMSRTLWTILVLLIPNAIGFILYFLLRTPLQVRCPKCGNVVDPRVNFCPRCRYSFHPTCSQCRTAVRPGDTFCANCGAQIEETAQAGNYVAP
jgi:hypothetical protein